jgi:putative Ca2+/H+ antiporter (TMEM165/GDT1 family)
MAPERATPKAAAARHCVSARSPRDIAVESFFVSTGLVALAEIGDKTQLLALVLAARYRAPVAVVLGILFATLANHGLAASLGVWLASFVPQVAMNWAIALSFVAMAFWALKPDTLEDGEARLRPLSAFLATLVAFFIVEIGDKTQIATVALAARYEVLGGVIAGTTLGMMIANVPAVIFGEWLTGKINMRVIRYGAAAMFLVLGVATVVAVTSGRL